MAYGFVYVLRNPAMPGFYKIGFTERAPLERCKELSRATAIPLEFQTVCYGEVDDAQALERRLHYEFAQHRVCDQREFFKLGPKELQSLLSEICESCDNYCEGRDGFLEGVKMEARRAASIEHFLSQDPDPGKWGRWSFEGVPF